MQLSFEGMLEGVDKEVFERSRKIKIEHVGDCNRTCLLSKRDRTYMEIKRLTEILNFLIEYFKKYSPESIWGTWIQNYYHVEVRLSG